MKKWYLSKTLWVNASMFAGLFAQQAYGFVFSPEEQAAVIVVANVLLRIFTKEEISK